jgi:hypothetical protein
MANVGFLLPPSIRAKTAVDRGFGSTFDVRLGDLGCFLLETLEVVSARRLANSEESFRVQLALGRFLEDRSPSEKNESPSSKASLHKTECSLIIVPSFRTCGNNQSKLLSEDGWMSPIIILSVFHSTE